jgi:hypothetical protein
MTILVVGKRRCPIRMGCCSGMPSSQRLADRFPPKAKVTRSNRVGRATKSITLRRRPEVSASKTHHKLTNNNPALAQNLRGLRQFSAANQPSIQLSYRSKHSKSRLCFSDSGPGLFAATRFMAIKSSRAITLGANALDRQRRALLSAAHPRHGRSSLNSPRSWLALRLGRCFGS